MNQQHLAIASIPVQEWKTVLEPEEALSVGTIFPELDMPFYVTQGMEKKPQDLTAEEILLKRIQEVSFFLDDIRLFMDTHPDNKNGLELLKNTLRKRKELLKEFAIKYYPLTMDCMADIYEENPLSECYCWQEGPIPWEGACV